MSANLNSRVKKAAARVTGSIAFYPAVIAVLFLVAFWGMITLDDSVTGKHIKATWHWLRMKDAATARLVASTIAGGMLSFTVFSFSMVMIVLNQTASKMSNRILETIIRNRFQQIVLGFYIGTVMYSLFLMTAIRDIDNGVYVPALSTYLLILFAIIDIFLFIYFLHFVTQYAKYQTIINRIHTETRKQLKAATTAEAIVPFAKGEIVNFLHASHPGYFTGCDEKDLLCIQYPGGISIRFLHPVGSYLLKGLPLLEVKSARPLSREVETSILESIEWGTSVSNESYVTGFAHLSEVAVKALSPGINDPATAILSLHVLADLFAYVLKHSLKASASNVSNSVFYQTVPPQELMTRYLLPIWDYGKKDRSIQEEVERMAVQLLQIDKRKMAYELLQNLLSAVRKEKVIVK